MKKKTAVCLVSGGLDSCVAACWAARRYSIRLVHFTYGQRTAKKELISFQKICRHLGVPAKDTQVIDLDFLGRIGGSALTDKKISVPHSLSVKRQIPITYVPFRNSVFLSCAVAWAEVSAAERVIIGAVGTDRSGYPDCRAEYFKTFNQLVAKGSKAGRKIKIETPLITLKKAEIVTLGLKLKSPFQWTWSCYENDDTACGECESCYLRLAGFAAAGVHDPLPYRQKKSK